MTRKIISVGDGRIVEMPEGPWKDPWALEYRQARTPGRKFSKAPRTPPTNNHFDSGCNLKELHTREGYKEWHARQHSKRLRCRGNLAYPQPTRLGLPNGLRGWQVDDILYEARLQAKRDLYHMKKIGIVALDDERAEEAMLTTLEVMRAPVKDYKMKLAAARQVLEWSRAKPVSKSEVTVNAAEAWLDNLAEQAKNG